MRKGGGRAAQSHRNSPSARVRSWSGVSLQRRKWLEDSDALQEIVSLSEAAVQVRMSTAGASVCVHPMWVRLHQVQGKDRLAQAMRAFVDATMAVKQR